MSYLFGEEFKVVSFSLFQLSLVYFKVTYF